MSKKNMIILFICLFIIFAIIFVWLIIRPRVDIDFPQKGNVIFHGEEKMSMELSQEDLTDIVKIFEGKGLYKDNPACGHGGNVVICFDDSESFCLPSDICPTIYWSEKDMYFDLSLAEQKELYSILNKYGTVFPSLNE